MQKLESIYVDVKLDFGKFLAVELNPQNNGSYYYEAFDHTQDGPVAGGYYFPNIGEEPLETAEKVLTLVKEQLKKE